MKFRVFAEGVSSSYDDERSHYLVRKDGVLEVFTADGRKVNAVDLTIPGLICPVSLGCLLGRSPKR